MSCPDVGNSLSGPEGCHGGEFAFGAPGSPLGCAARSLMDLSVMCPEAETDAGSSDIDHLDCDEASKDLDRPDVVGYFIVCRILIVGRVSVEGVSDRFGESMSCGMIWEALTCAEVSVDGCASSGCVSTN